MIKLLTVKAESDVGREVLDNLNAKLFVEFWPRLEKCLTLCSEEQLWFRFNESTNSIGNLVLHLEGNLRQWIIHGVGGAEDVRNRKKEFATSGGFSKEELKQRLEVLKAELQEVWKDIPEESLSNKRHIQGFETSVLGALIHGVEHYSYHLGQVSMIVKMLRNIDLKYYENHNLD